MGKANPPNKTLKLPIRWKGKEFEELEEKLKQTEMLLREKSTALDQILNYLENEKRIVQDQVLHNVHNLLFPTLEKLKRKATNIEVKYLDLIQQNLQKLTDSFGRSLRSGFPQLTLKEIEICNMIRNGFVSKDMAFLLKISHLTVEAHRHQIRKKLGISNQKTNLASHLQSL